MNASFLQRYERDHSRPTAREAFRDVGVRVLAPAVALWAAITALGFLIVGPLDDLPFEDGISQSVAETRTATWNTITDIWSRIGNTEIVIGTCVVVCLVVWWRTKEWWFAVIPAIAISVQATVFVISTTIVGRDRPDVEKLDPAPPTSSYPSGHMGAATALYLSFAMLAQRIETAWLRRTLTVLLLVVPVLVGYARLYRGMHHLVDILVGAVNGIVCALLAWFWLRRDRGDSTAAVEAERAVERG